jgi:hypothetical protein
MLRCMLHEELGLMNYSVKIKIRANKSAMGGQ